MSNFEMRKVVNPHKHMPEDIKDAFFEAMRDWELSNDSYVDWTVGEFKYSEEEDGPIGVLTKWLDLNFENGERLMLLHWW